ncbi:chromosome partitioning protein ParB [Gemmatimonadetes bacterium T265]|nr:chromosome partitioning protein ParB [Gemmatimonadetes bacterium T265]
MPPAPPRRLGRGLEALLASRDAAEPTTEERSALRTIPIADIRPNPYQPRHTFRPDELAELEASLRSTGLLQPVTVRPAAEGRGYELVAGERRLRAATNIGWTEIPAVVKPIDDRTLLTLALVENLQRADLDALEEAEGYQRLLDEFGLTQQQIADVVGKDRSTVASTLRLLALPASVRRMVQDRELTAGHARALLALGEERPMAELAREAVANGSSVREVERRVRAILERPPRPAPPASDARPAEVRRTEDHLRRHFATDVSIRLSGEEKGEIRIAFYSADDFDRLLSALGTRPN